MTQLQAGIELLARRAAQSALLSSDLHQLGPWAVFADSVDYEDSHFKTWFEAMSYVYLTEYGIHWLPEVAA